MDDARDDDDECSLRTSAMSSVKKSRRWGATNYDVALMTDDTDSDVLLFVLLLTTNE
jgi:hypothetical protein